MGKKILYFDLDGVLADYYSQPSYKDNPDIPMQGFFESLKPLDNAIEAFKELYNHYDCFFLTTAPWTNTHSLSEKRIWVEKHLGELAFKRLITTHRKDLLKGDYLIDDRTVNGAAEFEGEHIHFGSERFPNWESILRHLLPKKKRVVVFTGAGISAESGIATFRARKGGVWTDFDVSKVATKEAWQKDRETVLAFHNMVRKDVGKAKPNAAHFALTVLEEKYNVTIITQNIDDLHERAGSKNIIHLHGEITKARSSAYIDKIHGKPDLIDIGYNDINLGDRYIDGSQLKPHTVLFGEYPFGIKEAYDAIDKADILIIIGTSLQIDYTHDMLSSVPAHCEIYYIDPSPMHYLDEFGLKVNYIEKSAVEGVTEIISKLGIEPLNLHTINY